MTVLEYPYELDGPELTKDQIIDLFIAMGYEYVKVVELVEGGNEDGYELQRMGCINGIQV